MNVCTENDEALYRVPQGVGTVEKLFLFVCCSGDNTIVASSLQLNSMMVLSSRDTRYEALPLRIPPPGQKKPGTHRPGIMNIG